MTPGSRRQEMWGGQAQKCEQDPKGPCSVLTLRRDGKDATDASR